MLISCAPAACQNPATETCISMADAIQKSNSIGPVTSFRPSVRQ